MQGIAIAIVVGAILVAGTDAYLNRYEVVTAASPTSYRVHDRWTRRIASCTHLPSYKAAEPAEVDCSTWGPLIGSQP